MMASTPEITCIMPAYNVGTYISRAIDSIITQDFTDWELVIVDDCSTDNTTEVVELYVEKDDRIRLIRRTDNSGGPFVPRKDAIESAKADIIAPLDADDWIDSDYLGILFRLKKSLGAEIVYPSMYGEIPGGGRKRLVPVEGTEFDKVFRGADLVKRTLDGWKLGANGGLLDKDLYLRCMNTFENPRFMFADEILTRVLLHAADRVVLSTAGYNYFLNDESITHVVNMNKFGGLYANLKLKEFIYKNYPEGSEERVLIEIQIYKTVIECLRFLAWNSSAYDSGQKRIIWERLRESYGLVKWDVVKPGVGQKYYKLMKSGLKPACLFLKMYGRFFQK